jgi:hypothetical protein
MQISQSVEFLVFSDLECVWSEIGKVKRFYVILKEVAKFEIPNEVIADVTVIRNIVLCVL